MLDSESIYHSTNRFSMLKILYTWASNWLAAGRKAHEVLCLWCWSAGKYTTFFPQIVCFVSVRTRLIDSRLIRKKFKIYTAFPINSFSNLQFPRVGLRSMSHPCKRSESRGKLYERLFDGVLRRRHFVLSPTGWWNRH